MATVAADRLAQQHQRDIATIAGGVVSVVAATALGADPAAIGTWYWGAVDGLITRIQVGYSQTRNSAMSYLPRHAALSGAGPLQLAPGSLDVGRLRTSLQVTGPVAFKQAIKAGADTDEALRSMASQMSGAAERYVRDGDRDVIEQTALRGGGIVGWRRRLSGRACGFCAMLASRGAVYVNKQRATVSARGTRYHDHCRCYPEPLYSREDEPASVQLLQRQWQRVTAGHGGRDAMRVWRRHWEQRVTPQARERFGLAARMPSGGRAVPGSPVQVRQLLADAQSPEAVSRVLAAEYQRITGRTMVVELRGSVATAREHAEGVLRAVEQYPDIEIRTVRTGRTQRSAAYAEADRHGREIIFSDTWSTVARRDEYLGALAEDVRRGWHPSGTGSPVGVAIHETGHLFDPDFPFVDRRIDELLAGRGSAGDAFDRTVRDGISGYASHSRRELVAEAFADVVGNGARASDMSRSVIRVVEDGRKPRGPIPGPTFGRLPSMPDFAGLPVARLTAMVREHGITVPTGLRKPALVQLVDDLDRGVRPELARQQAVMAITAERRAAADALIRAAELGPQSSARALQHVGRVLRRDLPPELQKPFAPLLDALDAADITRVQAALPAVARSAKLRLVGGSAGEVKPFKRGEMEWIGDQRGDTVFVIRPGYAATVDGGSVTLRRAAVAPASPEQVAALPAKKAAKKAPAKKAAPAKATAAATDRYPLAPGYRGPTARARHMQREEVLKDLERAGDGGLGPQGPGREEAVEALQNMGLARSDGMSWKITDEGREFLARRAPAAAPAKKATARAQDLTGSRGLSSDPAVRAVQVENRIREAFGGMQQAPGGWVGLAELRERLNMAGLTRDEVDDALRRLARHPGVRVAPFDNQRALRQVDRDAALALGDSPKHMIAFGPTGAVPPLRPLPATPAKKATPAKAAKKAVPKPPPVPERMTAPALRKELTAAGAPEELLAGVPKPVLARHVTSLRETGDPLGAGRLRQDIIDRRRALAEALAEAAELLDSQASKTVLSSRAASRLKRVEELVKGWPQEAPLRSLVTAMTSGSPAAIRRAITAAERRGAVKRIGPTSGDVTTYDRKAMSPLAGEKIPDGAQVRVVRPGYEVDIAGERVVLMRPVVEVDEAVGSLPSRRADTVRELMAAARGGSDIKDLEARIARVVDGDFAGIRTRLRTDDSGLSHYATVTKVYLSGELVGPTGRQVGSFIRTIELDTATGDLIAHHEWLGVSRTLRGSGFAHEFNENLLDWYRRSGVKRVYLYAGDEVGAYAWARAGYDFADAAAVDEFLGRARTKIGEAISAARPPRGITKQQLSELQSYIEDVASGRIPAHALDVSQFGRRPGQAGKSAMWPGKWLLLGGDAWWRGVLYL